MYIIFKLVNKLINSLRCPACWTAELLGSGAVGKLCFFMPKTFSESLKRSKAKAFASPKSRG